MFEDVYIGAKKEIRAEQNGRWWSSVEKFASEIASESLIGI